MPGVKLDQYLVTSKRSNFSEGWNIQELLLTNWSEVTMSPILCVQRGSPQSTLRMPLNGKGIAQVTDTQ